jgi:hypothetical protein
MYTAPSVTAYQSVHQSRTRLWSVPSGPSIPESVEPEFGAGRIFGPDVCATIDFTPRFSLPPDARIFTIGSCFAREVEDALLAQGFNVLTRTGDYGYGHGYLNRYNTWAMAQEIDFAVGGRQFDERSISRLHDGGFIDLTSYGRFDTADEALELRRRTTILFKNILEADVVIITAGLSEIWYDTAFDYYTNIAPSGAALAYPDRFEFRLLGYQDNHQALCRLVEGIRKIRPACNILATVSPVPLNATFVNRDVLISNSYSKACLRTAVEELLWAYPFVDYFPSFEMVNLSDPAMVWEADYRHVKREFVDRIMFEFKRRYVVSD